MSKVLSFVQKHAVNISLGVTYLALVCITLLAWSKPACLPWPDVSNQEPVTCYAKHTHVVQTISEMTARTGLTAELLSAAAAASLIVVYGVLGYIREHKPVPRLPWRIVDASYYVGALGFVGLTVWSLRVNGTVHTCFTAQTIIAIFIQVTALRLIVVGPMISWLTFAWVLMLVSMVSYVSLIQIDAPDPVEEEYFKPKYYRHAYWQFVFFTVYFLQLAMLASRAAAPVMPTVDKMPTDGYRRVSSILRL